MCEEIENGISEEMIRRGNEKLIEKELEENRIELAKQMEDFEEICNDYFVGQSCSFLGNKVWISRVEEPKIMTFNVSSMVVGYQVTVSWLDNDKRLATATLNADSIHLIQNI